MIRAQMIEKISTCQFLDNAKKQHHPKNPTCSVNQLLKQNKELQHSLLLFRNLC